ncbi:unnamed protein product [Haemonchus placei]|uniref:Transmembrane protein n=1 Tax=Haemonchus placei TaxID=6290 RepID=A0A0N4X1K9_HAEPC|nr:unnamed protein product [Haemonchus placei]
MNTKRSRKPVQKLAGTKPGIFKKKTKAGFTQHNGRGEQVTERRGKILTKGPGHDYDAYNDKEDEGATADFGVEVWNPVTSEDARDMEEARIPDDPAMTPIDLFSLSFGIAFVFISYMFHFF